MAERLETKLEGVALIEPAVFGDERGFFVETFSLDSWSGLGVDASFVQHNHSRSSKGTLRGLHGQTRHPQGKLLRVVEGEIYDVAVDLRPGSPTFCRHVAVTLSAENFHQFYIPPGFAHGFCVLSERAQLEYKCTDFYRPGDEFALRWDDPGLAIPWPVADPVLSPRDAAAQSLKDYLASL